MRMMRQLFGKTKLGLLGSLILSIAIPEAFGAAATEDGRLQQLIDKFSVEYTSLRIPPIDFDYTVNFKKIPSLIELRRQETSFNSSLVELTSIDYTKLTSESQVQFIWLKSVLGENMERVYLEKDFKESGETAPEGGLFKLRNHERWYGLYSRRFASREIAPAEISRIGLDEVTHIREQMRTMQSDLGFPGRDAAFYAYLNSEIFQIRDLPTVIHGYESMRTVAWSNLAKLFPVVDVSPVAIAPVPDANKDTPPGLYKHGDKTFYFSFYGQQHNKRAMEWLLLHEGIPGHHYQFELEDKSSLRPSFAKLFKQYGFVEGWGAYVEKLGPTIGLFKDKTSEFGRLEWDLVRSIRLAIDVGIHVEGWNRTKAIAFWKEHVPNQDQIAEREIDRITRWPAQVISYKTGELAIGRLEHRLKDCLKSTFDIRRFHQLVLERGNLPFSALDIVFDKELKEHHCS
jgi:uncharacterized protein (DUF885 family)